MLRPISFRPGVFLALVTVLAAAACADTYSGPSYDLVLPDGWVQIPQDVVQQTMSKLSSSNTRFRFDAGFQPKGQPWFTYPYVLVQTIPYPKEPSEAEMRKLISQLSGGQLLDQAKQQLSPGAQKLVSNMSVKPGELDTTTHTFKVFLDQDVAFIGKINALIDSHFGHNGMVNINCYARGGDFDKYAPQFQQLTGSFAFHSGEEFQGSAARANGNLLGRIGAYGLIAIVIGVIFGAFRKKKA